MGSKESVWLTSAMRVLNDYVATHGEPLGQLRWELVRSHIDAVRKHHVERLGVATNMVARFMRRLRVGPDCAAEDMLVQTLAVEESRVGTNSPILLILLNRLIDLHNKSGRPFKAVAYEPRIRDLSVRLIGMAQERHEEGKVLDELLPLMYELQAMDKEHLPEAARVLNEFAVRLDQEKRPAQAAQLRATMARLNLRDRPESSKTPV
jgi:hypothetical protein